MFGCLWRPGRKYISFLFGVKTKPNQTKPDKTPWRNPAEDGGIHSLSQFEEYSAMWWSQACIVSTVWR